MDRFVEVGVMRFRGSQNVGRQAPVSRSGFDEIEAPTSVGRDIRTRDAPVRSYGRSLLNPEHRRHLGELHLEHLAKQRADIDAGKKIARAARTLGGAGVVAELRVI